MSKHNGATDGESVTSSSQSYSLRTLLLAIALILTLPPLALEAVLLYRYSLTERERAKVQLEQNVRGVANLIDSKFAAAEAVLKVLAASPLITANDLVAYETLLRRVAKAIGHPLVLFRPDGKEVVNTSAQPGAALPHYDVGGWEQALAEQRSYVTDVFEEGLSGKRAVAVVVPVARDGALKLTIGLSLYGPDFADVLAAPGVPAHWVVSIVDRNGIHLVRSHRNEESAGRPLVPSLVQHLRQERSGTIATTTLEGIPVMSTTARAARSEWGVAIGRPIAELEAPLMHQFRNLLVGALVTIALGLALAWFVAREIDGAVGNVARQAYALARGEPLSSTASIIREARVIDRELAQAASVLQERELAMRKLTSTLEDEVKQRTAQLANANSELRAEMARREESEQNFSVLVQGVVDYSLILLRPDGRVATWNKGAERMKGYAAAEIVGEPFSRFYTYEDRAQRVPERALATAVSAGRFEIEGWRVRKDGERFWAHTVMDAIRDASGRLIGFAKITRDITERRESESALKRTQEELAQVQKIEATGQLTGGIAHDFNNMLAVILAGARLLRERLKRGEDVQQFIDAITEAAERGATLTKRLLAFARRQPLAPEAVDANRLVQGMSEIFRRTIPENIEIENALACGLWLTRVDPNALESALLNLVTNARDAMPEGGKLTIETANAHLDAAYGARHPEIQPGQYVMLAVTDTGAGMPPEVLQHAFEPFFTTKPIGQGTGLGLSQVYGFARQSEGHAKIHSEPGRGSTVKIYLPRLHDQATAAKERTVTPGLTFGRNGELVLLVEDEEQVRSLLLEMLAELRYQALSADGPEEALRLLETQKVALMITDVVMPGMNGRQLAEQASKRQPGLKTLFITGYTRNAVGHDSVLDLGGALLTKPFTLEALGQKLREMLDG